MIPASIVRPAAMNGASSDHAELMRNWPALEAAKFSLADED